MDSSAVSPASPDAGRLIDPLADACWDAVVGELPEAGVFHRSAWARVLSKTWGHRPRYLMVSEGGRPSGILPLMDVRSPLTGRRGVSLPFSDHCGFVSADPGATRKFDTQEAIARLAAENRWKTVELRGGPPPAPDATPSQSFLSHTLPLDPDPDRILRQVDGSVRRSIRKAERSNLCAEIRCDREAMLAFSRLHARTRRRHGLPPQPDRFFLAIHEELVEPGEGFVSLVSRGREPVAAAVFLLHGTSAVFKFGASDERHLALRPNHLVFWSAIRWLCRGGATRLDFGRTSPENHGLRRFKRSWGTAESPLHYWKYRPASRSWVATRDRASGLHNALFSRLPLAVNRLLGAALYPHLD